MMQGRTQPVESTAGSYAAFRSRMRLSAAMCAVAACLAAGLGHAAEAAGETICGEQRAEIALALAGDGSISVNYALRQATSSLRLKMGELAQRLRLEAAGASMAADGTLRLPNPRRSFSVTLFADPPERRYAGSYPPAFAVQGRGMAVYLPYLLPDDCGDAAVFVRGGAGLAIVADGAYRRVEAEQAYRIANPSGFVLLGANLRPDAMVQFPKSLPAWLDEAIRESHASAQREVPGLLGVPRKEVAVLVDFSTQGSADRPLAGGDATTRGACAMRLWFRGEAWRSRREDLRRRMNDVLVHELAHCYQEPAPWTPWAHEGHARFVEWLVAARLPERRAAVARAIEAFGEAFNRCMNDLRVGTRHVAAYPCGAVAYWLRWIETGRVRMMAEADARAEAEARTMASRFLDRTATEADVVGFIRVAGMAVEVEDGALEKPEDVRFRLVSTLLAQGCDLDGPPGYWPHPASLTLDAPGCPEFHGFELQAVAGRHVVRDVHAAYAATVAACGAEGRVAISGGDAERKWVRCDRAHEWPSTIGARYRLAAPFDGGQAAREARDGSG